MSKYRYTIKPGQGRLIPGMSFKIRDEFSAWLDIAKATSKSAYRAGLRHIGFEFLSDLKDLKKNTLKMKLTPKLSNLQRYQWIQRFSGAKGLRAKLNPGDPARRNKGIARALRFDAKRVTSHDEALIGFPQDFAKQGIGFQTGGTRDVTEGSRSLHNKAVAWAMKRRKAKFSEHPISFMRKLKETIRIPDRNFVAPTWNRHSKRYEKEFIGKFSRRYAKFATDAKKRAQ